MSTTSTTAAAQAANANEFELQDHAGRIKVTYYPTAPGPVLKGQEPGSLVSYSGPEGQKTFRGSQVETQDTPLGKLISVPLKLQDDTGAISFAFCIPPILVVGGTPQAFTTFCAKVHKPGFIVNPGAHYQYDVEKLKGTAKHVMLPV